MSKKKFHPTPQLSGPLRAAIRTEGDDINVYLAPMDTMKGAVRIATFHRDFNEAHADKLEVIIKHYASEACMAFVNMVAGSDIAKETVMLTPQEKLND